MSIDINNIKKFLEDQRSIIEKDKKRLGLLETDDKLLNNINTSCDKDVDEYNKNLQESKITAVSTIDDDNKENLNINNTFASTENQSSQIGQVKCNDVNNFEKNKEAFIEKLSQSENPLTVRSNDNIKCAMLRYGEYSPNNPQLRVTAAPYLGLGEYDQKRSYYLQKQKADYLRHIAKVQYDLHSKDFPEKELSPQSVDRNSYYHLSPSSSSSNHRSGYNNSSSYRSVDQRLTSAQNALLKADVMDKPKGILTNRRTGSPRERLLSDLQHSYSPSFLDGFSYQDRADELDRERRKRESYQQELRLQIEEKRRLQALRDEQERREQELENKRLEQQLLRMQEEQMMEEQRRHRRDEQMRRHSEDIIRRRQDMSRNSFRKHADSESSVVNVRNTTEVASTSYPHYSPPVSRRNPYSSAFADRYTNYSSRYDSSPSSSYHHHSPRFDTTTFSRKDSSFNNRMDGSSSFNTYDTLPLVQTSSSRNRFSRFDSLSRIDSLNHRFESFNLRGDSMSNLTNGQRRHSATQQDLSLFRRSPKLQRRSSSGRFDDTLPIPVLKAHSPVARELKNSIPFNSSRHSSDAVRKLEDKWQIPAVQKNILNHNENRSILTQLGAIRMQLQQEQLRMDETLRKRGITQSKAVDFH